MKCNNTPVGKDGEVSTSVALVIAHEGHASSSSRLEWRSSNDIHRTSWCHRFDTSFSPEMTESKAPNQAPVHFDHQIPWCLGLIKTHASLPGGKYKGLITRTKTDVSALGLSNSNLCETAMSDGLFFVLRRFWRLKLMPGHGASVTGGWMTIGCCPGIFSMPRPRSAKRIWLRGQCGLLSKKQMWGWNLFTHQESYEQTSHPMQGCHEEAKANPGHLTCWDGEFGAARWWCKTFGCGQEWPCGIWGKTVLIRFV